MPSAIIRPENIALIGNEVAVKWTDGSESYFPMEILRAASPSAENQGETDLLGRRYGGEMNATFSGVTVLDWQWVGGYALQFRFSDGHRTGLFSFDYLKKLEAVLREDV
ncbi:MAG: gamma-butyrobetaine hydroxylase-like domain-containing protein [Candidatus Methylacidiphilales bacterium]